MELKGSLTRLSARSTPWLHRLGDAASEIGREPPQHPVGRALLQLGLPALVLGFLVFTVVNQWHELEQLDVRFRAGWLVPGTAALLAFLAVSGFGWYLLTRMLGQHPQLSATQMAWGKSLLARYVPGSVLFVVTRVVLSERAGVPRRVTVTAMAYETGLSFAAAALFATVLLFAAPGDTESWLRWAMLAAVPVPLIAMHPSLFGPIVNRLLALIGRREVPALLSRAEVLGLFAYYLASWAVMGLAVFCIARVLFPVEVSDWGVIASAQAVAFCAAVVSLVFPGGLGVRDGAFAWAAQTVVPSFAVAAAIALLARLAMSASEVIYAATATAVARRFGARGRGQEVATTV